MTVSFEFSGSQNPWANGALTQSNPGTTRLGASGLYQSAESTGNRIGLAGVTYDADRSIGVQGSGSRLAWSDWALSSSLYIDYVDEAHYVRIRGYQPNTNVNVFRVYRSNGGAETAIYTSPQLTDGEVDGAHALRVSVEGGEGGSLVSIYWDDSPHGSHLVEGWSPSGDPLLGLERGATSTNYLTVSALTFTGEISGPTIGPINDGSVTQGETGLTFRVSGLESAPTSATFGGESLAFTQEAVIGGEGDIDITLTDPIPLDLADGDYDLIVSNDDETATKSVGYVVTHPIALPEPGEYDSNSILAGLGTSFPAGSFANLPIVFVGGESITPTFKAPYTGWHDADLTQSIDDILEAPEGAVGTFSATAEALFPDGTTDTWVITLNIQQDVRRLIIRIADRSGNLLANQESVAATIFAAPEPGQPLQGEPLLALADLVADQDGNLTIDSADLPEVGESVAVILDGADIHEGQPFRRLAYLVMPVIDGAA